MSEILGKEVSTGKGGNYRVPTAVILNGLKSILCQHSHCKLSNILPVGVIIGAAKSVLKFVLQLCPNGVH